MNALTRPFLILAVAAFLGGCEQFCECEQVTRETIIVPAGSYFLKPNISDNECISRDLNFIERTPDKFDPDSAILEPIAFITYEGVLHRTIGCPSEIEGADVEEIALVELDDGRLVWIDTKKILQDTSH
jgi:hypothetical protein